MDYTNLDRWPTFVYLELGQRPGNALSVLFLPLWSYKCGEHLCLCWFGSLCKYAMGYYLWYHVSWLATSVPRIE